MDKVLSFLGMCRKAGALETGEEAVGAAARKEKAVLILTASDTSDNTAKRATNLAEWSHAENAALPYSKEELGEMLGKRVCAVLALTDINMAASFLEKLSAECEEYTELFQRLKAKQNRNRSGKTGGLAAKTQDKSKKGGM
jgi:ribosomal protein L7Ae-like RNA K-turn-binding protein